MANSNYLIGNGERLVTKKDWDKSVRPTQPVYSMDEVLSHIRPQWEEIVHRSAELPAKACPGNRTVFSMTLHPKYTSMSAYPRNLFRSLDLKPVGSRVKHIIPRKPRGKSIRPGAVDLAPEYFLAVDRENIPSLLSRLGGLSENAQKDFVKIEAVHFIEPGDRIRTHGMALTKQRVWEAVIHGDGDYVFQGLGNYLEELAVMAHKDLVFNEGDLWFIALEADEAEVREQVALFSFLRAIRPMPQLRPIVGPFRSHKKVKLQVPQEEPLDNRVRMAILDGGLAKGHGFEQYLKYRLPPGIGKAAPEGLEHGQAVTSAFLFGPLEGGAELAAPPCLVDHWRVIDTDDLSGADLGLYKVLKRIQDILEQNNYQAVNLSLGPELPIEDGEPHAWTVVLDHLLENGQTLLCTAVGNSGEYDWESGNARVQPPSDVVNGLGVGACNSRKNDWKRASYSCVGPWRRPGYTKPDFLAFGGCRERPFGYLEKGGALGLTLGTSFSAPYAAKMAMEIDGFFENELSPLALKALLIHHADNQKGLDKREVGWGKLPEDVTQLVASSGDQAHILYQGTLDAHTAWKLPIPLPDYILHGNVTLRATLCFACPVDPTHPLSYTRAGILITFRPDPINSPEKTRPFFQNKDYWPQEVELRKEAMKWESVLKRERRYRGTTLSDPVFELSYHNRDGGDSVHKKFPLNFAAVISITAKKEPELYNQIINRYKAHLAPLRPRLQVRQRIVT